MLLQGTDAKAISFSGSKESCSEIVAKKKLNCSFEITLVDFIIHFRECSKVHNFLML